MPVRTAEDLDALDLGEIVEGYLAGRAGDPEPGHNRGRAFWHGWRNGAMDSGRLEIDDAARALVRAVAPRGTGRG